jgi:photosystem II stability/assembly factor-like uncharacterized protein
MMRIPFESSVVLTTPRELLSVSFADPQTGWASGLDGQLFSTTDGGMSWDEARANFYGPINAVTFPRREVGYAAGVGRDAATSGPLVGVVLGTRDGGQKWSISPQLTPYGHVHGFAEFGLEDAANVLFGAKVPAGHFHSGVYYSVCSVDGNSAWVVGGGGVVLTTRDSGRSWDEQKLTENTLRTVFFLDNQRGLVAGDAENIFQTTDGGRSWIQVYDGIPGWPRQAITSIAMRSSDEGWAVGFSGIMLRTRSGGRSWELQKTLTSGHLFSIAFGQQAEGFAGGAGGELLYSENGEQHWAVDRIEQVRGAVRGIAISDEDTVWAVGGEGGIETKGVLVRLKRK